MSFSVASRANLPAPLPVASLIQKQLAEVRVRVEIQQPETAEQFFDALVRGHYDLALAAWIADTPDPADLYEALLWSKIGS
jgi:ABC-type oligopeptide transport system substrate-binding subunit